MQTRQIMQRDLITILPSSTVYDAAVKMKEHRVGSILVVDEDLNLKGILTDRDIVMAVATDYRDPRWISVSDVMTANPKTIGSSEDIESALRIMNSAHVHRLPVTENGTLVGLLSSADLAAEMKDEFTQIMGLEEAFSKRVH